MTVRTKQGSDSVEAEAENYRQYQSYDCGSDDRHGEQVIDAVGLLPSHGFGHQKADAGTQQHARGAWWH